MYEHRFNRLTPAFLAITLTALLPAAASGQVRRVVSNQLAISEREASIHLEFADQGRLDIEFRDGRIFVGDAVVGTYDRRDELDIAWRKLLGEVATLDDGALARALEAWEPPSSLAGNAVDVALLLDGVLEGTLLPPAVDSGLGEREVDEISASHESNLLKLLSRSSILPALTEALGDLQEEGIKIYVEQDVVIGAGDRVIGPLVLVDGSLTVEGRIDGDVVVTQGSVRLDEGGLITGELRLVDARLYSDGGVIEGRVVSVESDQDQPERSIRGEIRAGSRDRVGNTGGHTRGDRTGVSAFFGNITHGLAEVFEDLVQLFLLAAGSLLVVFFWKDRLNVIADAVRRTPIRAGMVGMAGAFLFLPAWILGSIALVVSIVGILALPFWVLLFPVVAAVAVGIGYLAVARNVGEWLADQRFSRIDRVQATNTLYAVVAGIVALAVFSVLGHLLGMFGPILRVLQTLVAAVGAVVTICALLVGFGAVLMTRGGRQPESYGGHDPFDDDIWTPEVEVEVEMEDVIEAEEVRDESAVQTEAPDSEAPAGG
ncbi:MAG: hypothetical protein BMS9Abin29_0646 [Gemmatimonadota bacterium]|nr:MAG: hypothetical protein BMS9Abin29_0646 [Gemmatimonadota bacterium]